MYRFNAQRDENNHEYSRLCITQEEPFDKTILPFTLISGYARGVQMFVFFCNTLQDVDLVYNSLGILPTVIVTDIEVNKGVKKHYRAGCFITKDEYLKIDSFYYAY